MSGKRKPDIRAVEPGIKRRTYSNGEASYPVWVRVNGEPETFTASSLIEACPAWDALKARHAELKAAEQAAKEVEPHEFTFDQWWDQWWPVHFDGMAESSVDRYESVARCHVLPYWRDTPIRDIRTKAVNAFGNHMDVKGKPGRATADKALTHIRSAALRATAAEGLIAANPARDSPRRTCSKSRRKPSPTGTFDQDARKCLEGDQAPVMTVGSDSVRVGRTKMSSPTRQTVHARTIAAEVLAAPRTCGSASQTSVACVPLTESSERL